MKFIKKHLTAIIVFIVCLMLLILAGFAVYRMFYPSNDKSVCGDRGVGAPEVTDEVINSIKEKIEATELTNSVTYYISNCDTTIKFFVDVKENIEFEEAKKIGDIILEGFSADVINFYDMAINLTQKTGKIKEYPAIGQKAKNSKEIYWVVNKEVLDSEE